MPDVPVSNHSVESVLRAIPAAEIRAKQEALAKLARRVTLRNDDASDHEAPPYGQPSTY